jgi:hypothetical protein
VIVAYALQKKETSHTTNDRRNISHLSVHRTAPLNVVQPTRIVENVKKLIEAYVGRLVILILQERTGPRLRDSPGSRMS